MVLLVTDFSLTVGFVEKNSEASCATLSAAAYVLLAALSAAADAFSFSVGSDENIEESLFAIDDFLAAVASFDEKSEAAASAIDSAFSLAFL